MDKVLKLLLDNAGKFVAENELARCADGVRTGIGQQIDALRKRGFQIDGAARQGYRLAGAPDRLYPELIRYRLNTVLVAREIVYVPELDSTNRAAKELAARGAAEGTLVVAEHQTRGRGRLDRRWLSEPCSGILCSLILYPDLPAASAFRLTMLASVAVARSITRVCGLEARIKWPNDVYVDNRKVCGILTECVADHDRIRYSVIGIGINVHGGYDADPLLAGIAASLSAEAGHAVSRVRVMHSMLQEIDGDYAQFSRTRGRHLLEHWESFSLVTGKAVTIVFQDAPDMHGVVQGISEDGQLLLRDQQGVEHTIVCGDVSLRI